MADPTRRTILDELTNRDGQTVFEICGRLASNHGLRSSRQAISQHLDLLEAGGLVETRREGQYKFHYINTKPLESIIERWLHRTTSDADPAEKRNTMRIHLTSVLVDDQAKAEQFYTEVLGFVKKYDVPAGGGRWLTVVSPQDPHGTELLLEPAGHPAVKPFKDALVADGIPYAQFAVDDVHAEYERLRGLGVHFTQPPAEMGPVTTAVFDDTCGNLIQIATTPSQ